MSRISCTFVKCIYNNNGKNGICKKREVQIGALIDPKDEQRKINPVCVDYKE